MSRASRTPCSDDDHTVEGRNESRISLFKFPLFWWQQASVVSWQSVADAPKRSAQPRQTPVGGTCREEICAACKEDPRIEDFVIRGEGASEPPSVASAALHEARDAKDAADAMLSVAVKTLHAGAGGASQKRLREEPSRESRESAAQERSNYESSRAGGSRGSSSSDGSDDDDDEEEEGHVRLSPSVAFAASASHRGGGTTRRRGDAPGASAAAFSASSALELFGLRSAAAQSGPRAQQQQQQSLPAPPPVSFLRAAAPSPLMHVASRLAQLDARAVGGAGMLDDETYSENAPVVDSTRFAGTTVSVDPVGGQGAFAHGLPVAPTLADLPSIAASLTASTSDFQRKSAMRTFLSSDDAVVSWLPSLLSALGEVGVGVGGAASSPAGFEAATASATEVLHAATFIVRYLRESERTTLPESVTSSAICSLSCSLARGAL